MAKHLRWGPSYKVCGEEPWAILGVAPDPSLSPQMCPLSIYTFQGVSPFKNRKPLAYCLAALQINTSLGGPAVGGARMWIVPNFSGERGIER